MSGFDENPFADPRDINPFADPAVTQVTQQSTRPAPTLDDYNPFADSTSMPAATRTTPLNQPPAGPAVMQPTSTFSKPPTVTSPPPPPYTPNPSTSIDTEELRKKQEELEKRAAELEAREEALRRSSAGPMANNWPPLPAFCPVKSCFFQDIELEIPVEFQRLVRVMYYFWMYYGVLVVFNFLGACTLIFSDSNATNAQIFGVSILYVILLIPLSFLCWFRPLYKAFKDDSSFNFMVFFFVFFFQFLWSILFSIGVGISSCGLITALGQYGANKGIGVFLTLIAVASIVFAAGCFFMLVKIHRIYRRTGASLAKAQTEFTTGVFQNQYVQQAAASAAKQAAQSAVNNPNNRF